MDSSGQSRPALISRIAKWVVLKAYRLRGYHLQECHPVPKRCVLLGAPHTTNWDFIFFLGAITELGCKPSFLGKLSLFKGLLRGFMYDMGGIPVDRSLRGARYVEQVVEAFEGRDELALVVAPEGTRGPIKGWRSGFYHIAHGAGVPIVPGWTDAVRRTGGIGEPIMPSGDYAADLAKLLAFYQSVVPGHPRLQALADSIEAAKEEANA